MKEYIGIALIILSIGGCNYLVNLENVKITKEYIKNGYVKCLPSNSGNVIERIRNAIVKIEKDYIKEWEKK